MHFGCGSKENERVSEENERGNMVQAVVVV
jgi:hypothetical protein